MPRVYVYNILYPRSYAHVGTSRLLGDGLVGRHVTESKLSVVGRGEHGNHAVAQLDESCATRLIFNSDNYNDNVIVIVIRFCTTDPLAWADSDDI